MYHSRKLIRDKIKEYLITIDGIGQNVFFNDPDTIQQDQIPCLFVNFESENVYYQNISQNPRIQKRDLQYSIYGFIKSSKDLNDKIDELSYKIEKSLSENNNKIKLDGYVIINNLISTDFEFNDNSELNIGCVKLTYNLSYRTLENNVSEII